MALNKKISNLKLSYLAGLIDGEGTVAIYKLFNKTWSKRTDYSIIVRISNTDIKMLQWLEKNIGGKYYTSSKATDKRKMVFHWQVCAKQAEELLRQVEKFLIIKKERANLALEFRKLYKNNHIDYYRIPESISDERKNIFNQMKELNRRGVYSYSVN